jgi:hypothetical protein
MAFGISWLSPSVLDNASESKTTSFVSLSYAVRARLRRCGPAWVVQREAR